MSKIRTVYAVKHRNENIRAASRSGGIFTAVSDVVLNNGGVVYGCALNDEFLAEHKRAVSENERNEFRGSKYIQSEINTSYMLCANDLKNGTEVLFSGTPCQIEALYNYLQLKNIDFSKLLTIDILCHGVPSPKVWKDYLDEKFKNKKIRNVDFRDKKNFGWRDHVETVVAEGKEYSSKEFTDLFYSHYILRPACFDCNYKRTQRIADITIGDYWRIENNDKQFDDDKGVSLVMLNTKKGKRYFDSCSNNLIIKEFPLATSIQPALDHNYVSPEKRAEFWDRYDGFSSAKLCLEEFSKVKVTFKQRIKYGVILVMKKVKLL